jgi:phenylacetyl-CoA:acceptor oxidoreductase
MVVKRVPTYCYQCVSGPDLLYVMVEDGKPVGIEPNYDISDKHPARGRICAKAYGLIHKTYNPFRIKSPMRRTNPRKGIGEDPKWEEITWDEALDLVAAKLREARAKGPLDENGYPRLAVTLGEAGTPMGYYGSFNAFLAAWGPVDYSFGSGQGVKCYHSEHLYGEYWHRAFIVAADSQRTKLVLSFGHNDNATGGVNSIWKHMSAKDRGMKWIQFEPHMSVTAATADEWIPIRPKSDGAFMLAMMNVMLHEMDWRESTDVDFLKRMTNAPYLVGPDGFYVRERGSGKPLVWDPVEGRARAFDDDGIKDFALTGEYTVEGFEMGPDKETVREGEMRAKPVFELLREHVKPYTPEWASGITDVDPRTIRRITREFVESASIGATTEVEGLQLPLRPVAILTGRGVSNGWGAYLVVWARTVLGALVGALETPGGMVGATTRLNKPMHDRLATVRIGEDGFMAQSLNPTGKGLWRIDSKSRNFHRALSPLVLDSSWSQALGPSTIAWYFMDSPAQNWPRVTPPDIYMIFRGNPMVSFMDPDLIARDLSRMPFMVAFAFTIDETNWFADVLLPEASDLEGLQLFAIGGTSYMEQLWDYIGVALRQPAAVNRRVNSMDMTDISTELAARAGFLREYNEAINRGILGYPLKTPMYDFSLDPERKYSAEEIWDRVCRAATWTLSGGDEVHGLDWFREHGFYLARFSRLNWYLHPLMVAKKLRYEVPYNERLYRVGRELERRLHEIGVHWWDAKLDEYTPFPVWEDPLDKWDEWVRELGEDPREYPFWMISTKAMPQLGSTTVANALLADVSRLIAGQRALLMNARVGRAMGLRDWDEVLVEAPTGKTARGFVQLREGVRPDVVVASGQLGNWLTPVAKDIKMININLLTKMSMTTLDGTGSTADLLRVRIRRVG